VLELGADRRIANSFGELAEHLHPSLFRMADLLFEKQKHSQLRQQARERERQTLGGNAGGGAAAAAAAPRR
jgi:hypothetical protein